jgi:hypothetical protein
MADGEKQPPFEITVPQQEFGVLRKNPKFIRLVRLARYVNQLSFCCSAVPKNPDLDDFIFRRQVANWLFFSSAVLFEALETVSHLGSEFRHFPSYRDGFARFWKNPDFVWIKDNYLNPARKKVTFHVDLDAIEKTLEWATFDKCVFMVATDERIENYYYPIADDIAINFLLGDKGSDEAQRKYCEEVVAKFSTIMLEFLRCAGQLLAEYAERKQWGIRTRVLPRQT